LIYIEGRLKTRVIEKDDGTKFYKTEVVVSNIIFLNKRSDFDDAGVNPADHEDSGNMF
jgi:single-strand DNA-binding protein